MARKHLIVDALTGQQTEIPFTPEEEAAADAAEPRRKVTKSLITQRLIEAGKIGAAMALLQSEPAAFARWIAADQPAVYADDADTLAMIAAIGADAGAILAP